MDDMIRVRDARENPESNGNLISSASHLAFQTIPILFSIKYVKSSMVEIDCDQAAPNYKAAMFQGKYIPLTIYFFHDSLLVSSLSFCSIRSIETNTCQAASERSEFIPP